jgi:hypothetical protein
VNNCANGFGSLHVHPIYPSIEDVPEVMVLDSWKQDLRDNDLMVKQSLLDLLRCLFI